MNVKDQLEQLGIKGRTADVYLALLQLGSGTIMQIALNAEIKRTTCYSILEDLSLQGLVSQSYRGTRRIFSAENPAALLAVHKKRERQIMSALPQLEILYAASQNKPTLQYYEGVEGIRYVDQQLLHIEDKEYFAMGSLQGLLDVLGEDYLRWYVEERLSRKIWSNWIRVRDQGVSNHGYMDGTETNLRRVRYFPKPILDHVAAVYVADNKLFVISSINECYGLIINSPELAAMIKSVWDILWPIAEE